LDNGVLDEFLKAKEEGKVRHIGFTGHQNYKAHLRMLERTTDMDVFTTCQMPINVLDPNYESFITNVLPKVIERGISPLAMKTLAFGNFFKIARNENEFIIPNRVSVEDAIQFVWSLPVTTLITGADSIALVKEKIAFAKSFKEMNKEKRMALSETVTDYAGAEVEWYKAQT
jgi:predicted aldo/keto reductase-like oxidoreductase